MLRTGPQVVLVLRSLWPLITKNPHKAKQWEERIATIVTTNPEVLEILQEYFVGCHWGLTTIEVDQVLMQVEQLGEVGIEMLFQLRRHSGPNKLLGNDQPTDPHDWQRYINLVAEMPDKDFDTADQSKVVTLRSAVLEVMKDFSTYAYSVYSDALLFPECIKFVAENLLSSADVPVMTCVGAVYRAFTECDADLMVFVSRIRALPNPVQLALAKKLKGQFLEAGPSRVDLELVEVFLKSAEIFGKDVLDIWQSTKLLWSTHRDGDSNKASVYKPGLKEVQALILAPDATPARLEAVRRLGEMVGVSQDHLAIDMLAGCLDDLENKRELVVRLVLDQHRVNPEALSYVEHAAMLRQADPERLQVIATTNFWRSFQECVRDENKEQRFYYEDRAKRVALYKDFVTNPAYVAHPQMLQTVIDYKNVCVKKANEAWSMEETRRAQVEVSKPVPGLRQKIARIFTKSEERHRIADAPNPAAQLTRADYVMSELHTCAGKLEAKIVRLADDTAKALVLTNMRAAVSMIGENEQTFDYCLSIADQDIFSAMVASHKLWINDEGHRQEMVNTFSRTALLREHVGHVTLDWNIFVWFKDLCTTTEGEVTARFLLKLAYLTSVPLKNGVVVFGVE